jgi:hypothetical protein
MTDQEKSFVFTPRDRDILWHMFVFGMTIFTVLHRLFFPGKKNDAVKSTLRRLFDEKLIFSKKLIEKRVCYQLTPKACALVGAARDRARALGPHARAERYALLWFCCLDPPSPRTLFNPGEHEQFAVDAQNLRRVHFYLEEAGEATLMGLIVLDMGTTCRRLVEKTAGRILKYLDDGWLDEVIRGGLFAVTILTMSEGKRRDILRSLKPTLEENLLGALGRILPTPPGALPFPVYVKVVPDLDRLIPIHIPVH